MASQGWPSGVTWNFTLLVMLLFAGCGGGGGDSGGNGGNPAAPTALATADDTVPVGSPVTLDGSASNSPSGAPLSYQWTLTAKPAGSTASLNTPNSVRATFTPDVAGAYTATLVVRANGMDSPPDAISITAVTGNVAPVANAGPDRDAGPSRPIILDGTASHDPNNATVTYNWRIVEQPPGSHPTLTNATSATPTFTGDIQGRYVLALTCSDGSMTSVDQVVIIVATGNLPPVANAGADHTVTTGQQVMLNGTGSSDPNGDLLTYSWCLKGRPEGSSATLSGANTARPTFTPDIAGSYVFCLTVSDGNAASASDSVVVEARLPSSVGGVLQAYVKRSHVMYPDINTFGRSVALDGNTLVVGADDPSCATGINGNQADTSCFRAGAVYVFTRTGETWSQQAYLKPSNTNGTFYFGDSVSLSGDTLAVGAWAESGCARGVNGDDQNQNAGDPCGSSGAVYVFTRSGSTWSQQAYLKASLLDPNGLNHERFGQTVAVSGNTIAVGAPGQGFSEGCPPCLYLGAVYVFTRSNGQWTQEALLRSSNPVNRFEAFGYTVALDGDTVAASNITESSCATGVNGDQFSNRTCYDTGAVYVFTRTAGVWSQQAYVKASNTSARLFGFGLAVNGDALIVGGPKEQSCATGINGNQSDTGCPEAGAVYIFTRMNNLWSQVAYVKAQYPNLQSFGGNFGSRVAFDGTTLAVSADDNNCARGFNPSPVANDCASSGAVYLFSRTATSWAQRAYVKASNPGAFDFFGRGVDPGVSGLAIAGNTLAVGATSEDSCATGINGNQNDNNCGVNPFTAFGGPDPNPAIGGSGAAYVYVMQ